MLNFAAPELLGMCNKCYKFECLGCDWNQEGQGKETIQMDVYAFGCLHYAVRPRWPALFNPLKMTRRFFSTLCLFKRKTDYRFIGSLHGGHAQAD